MEAAPQNVTFASNGGRAHGYLALPGSGEGPGLIVIQEWWGLTELVRRTTDRFAAEGFVALAPDLYGGVTTHDADEAARMMEELPLEGAARDLSGAVEFLLDHPAVRGDKVGTVGFCMGGAFVLVLAAIAGDQVAAAVPYYPVGPYEEVDLSGISSAVLGHFGSEDPWAPPDKARELEHALASSSAPEVRIHIHEGANHAFSNPQGENYLPDLAASTWEETAEFLRAYL